MSSKLKRKGMMYSALSAILFGTQAALMKILYAEGGNVISITFIRNVIAVVTLYVLNKRRKQVLQISDDKKIQVLMLSVLYSAVSITLYLSYQYIDSGTATVLHFSYPVVVTCFLVLFFREKLSRKRLGAMILCLVGIYLLKPSGNSDLFGMMIALMSGVLYACYIIIISKTGFKKIPAGSLSLLLISGNTAITGVLYIITKSSMSFMSVYTWPVLLLLGIFDTAAAMVLFQWGVSLCGGVAASLLSTFEPITAIVMGMLFFNETITAQMGLGIALILISIVILIFA